MVFNRWKSALLMGCVVAALNPLTRADALSQSEAAGQPDAAVTRARTNTSDTNAGAAQAPKADTGARAEGGAPLSLDMKGVRAIRFEGDDSKLVFTADTARPATAQVVRHGKEPGCQLDVAHRREADTLVLKLYQHNRKKRFSFFSVCTSEVAINLPPGQTVDVGLERPIVDLSGQYDTIRLRTKDAALIFAGQARDVDLKSGDLKVEMKLNGQPVTPAISLAADRVQAKIVMDEKATLNYGIEAPDNRLTLGLPQADDAPTRLNIQAKKLLGSIQPVARADQVGADGRPVDIEAKLKKLMDEQAICDPAIGITGDKRNAPYRRLQESLKAQL